MMHEVPQPDTKRFSPVFLDKVILFYVSRLRRGNSLSTLQNALQAFASADLVDQTVSMLIERGMITIEQKTLCLTRVGLSAASDGLGRDAKETWDAVRKNRLPLVALGLDPDASDIRSKFSNWNSIKAAAISVAFGLPKETMSSLKAVQSEIIWRVLRAKLGDLVGTGPFPAIQKAGPVERTLIGGMARMRVKSITAAMDALAARAIGVDKTNAVALRQRLIAIGIERSQQTGADRLADASGASTFRPLPGANGVNSFVANVNKVAAKLSTPPFEGRVAIAQVYDEYGKHYADAGSLKSFKDRLVSAAKRREVHLGRLDLPERMARELRERSETLWDREEVHFVITNWN